MRQQIFDDSAERLTEKAYRAVNILNMDPATVAVVAIHVDDPAWTDLANHLMPGTDWQQFRDRGELPIARGSVSIEIANLLKETVPDLATTIDAGAPEGHLFAFVMADGGASIFVVPYSQEKSR